MVAAWLLPLFLAVAIATCSEGVASDNKLRPKRRPSEDRVTIDLSALRPSLPGLVLYEYGDLAPKLVQVDMAALNPLIQPHVIWPQFGQLDDDDRPFELDSPSEAIPYLTMADVSPRRTARMTGDEWMYDFGGGGMLSSLHGSLPLADEVIVPLDWEEGDSKKKKKQKKNVFLTRGWRPGGERGSGTTSQKQQTIFPKMTKGSMTSNFNSYYSRNPGWSATPRRRETESEEFKSGSHHHHPTGKKDARTQQDPVRISGQESWSVPRQYWNVPHLFVNNWQ